MRSRTDWLVLLACIVALGIGSRVVHTGWVFFDKDLGDALYAAMVYALLSLFWKAPPIHRAFAAMILMVAVELFQLTLIPARLAESSHLAVRLAARLMGTWFSFHDLLSYAVGILVIYAFTRSACKIVR